MKLVAIHYHHSYSLPIAGYSPSKENFIRVCEKLPTDWAHLLDEKTGEILHTWRKEQ
jgi:hypothetical protein